MKKLVILSAIFLSFSVTSCSWVKLPQGWNVFKKEPAKTAYEEFQEKEGYPTFYEVFQDEELLASGNSSNTRVVIDLSDQRAQLLVEERVAYDIPCCTGRSGKKTPTGSFRIMEKLSEKKSNIYGKVYNGSKVVYGGDQRKYKGPRTKFVGTSLPYWMRLTGDGIGMHFSKSVKRTPASGGCIRMQMDGVKTIFSKVKRGTKVEVQP